MAGLEIQAHMVSQIVSAALDGRGILGYWTQEGEIIWIWSWSLVGGLLSWRFGLSLRLGLAAIASSGLLLGLCYAGFLYGIWIPLVPPALGLITTGATIAVARNILEGKIKL